MPALQAAREAGRAEEAAKAAAAAAKAAEAKALADAEANAAIAAERAAGEAEARGPDLHAGVLPWNPGAWRVWWCLRTAYMPPCFLSCVHVSLQLRLRHGRAHAHCI